MKRQTLVTVALPTAALLAACAAPVEVASPSADDPYLLAAKKAAQWISATTVDTADGATWPADPDDPQSSGPSLYSGSAGVVLFLLELGRVTGDPETLELARRGADQLLTDIEQPGLDAGLYTGLAGIGVALLEASETTGDRRYRQGTERVVELLAARAESNDTGDGARWSPVTDVIGGSAGIGLFLIDAAHRLDIPQALDLASAAGDGLLAVAQPAGPGLNWPMSPDYPRNMPNFSHGTAGVAYFLVTLARATDDPDYLDAALAGARYLQSIADTQGELCLIYHHDPGGEDLHYLSWCHGPAGTARLFYRLYEITHDDGWSEWVERSARAVRSSGVPEKQTPGFWNNVSQCCGSAGVLDFFLSLYRTSGDPEYLAYAQRVAANTLQRATEDDRGLRWIQAEHRVQPELLIAQTGFMQGAAGIGSALLRLHLVERGEEVAIRLPDSPW